MTDQMDTVWINQVNGKQFKKKLKCCDSDVESHTEWIRIAKKHPLAAC